MDAKNNPYPFKIRILIWVGLWCIILGLMAYWQLALQDSMATDLAYLPDQPPETLPEFAPPETTPTPLDGTQFPTPQSFLSLEQERPFLAATRVPEPATSPPTRIVATAIGLDSPIVPVGWSVDESDQGMRVVWEVASYAAGWHRNSVYPGTGGNVVLSGHNNVAGEVFRYLIALEAGDEIDLYVGEKVYPYAVADKMLLEEEGMPLEVRRQNAQWIAPTDHERLTLVTCWPYSTFTHRLIVIALPMP